MAHEWKFFKAGRMRQVALRNGDDLRALAELDKPLWTVLSADIRALRFDRRTLELLDLDGTGRVSQPEVLAAIDFLLANGVDLETLFRPDEQDAARLAAVTAARADLDKTEPTDADRAARAAWEAQAKEDPAILPLGERTAGAEAALAAVEQAVDGWFAVPDDLPLVTEEPDRDLPLADHVNPKYADAVATFAERVVTPLLGEHAHLTRREWNGLKAAFAPYRAWRAAEPHTAGDARAKLDVEERVLRYKLHLLEFLENFVSQRRLYAPDAGAMYRTGTLYLDGRAFELCFYVDDPAAHAALAAKSNCCLVYAKLERKAVGETRNVCAVVTAGRLAPLYAGRRGIFFDRDGNDWEAVVTNVIEGPVSLSEAFWEPWNKLFGSLAELVKKFIASKNAAQTVKIAKPDPGVLASSVAAIGMGVGMVGAACAGAIGVIAGMPLHKTLLGILALFLLISGPSMILAWFKMRRRDLGAILNASGWAVNRPLRFSQRLARTFTRKGTL